MSRAPASASGRGEPPSDEAGRSNWGAAAGSSASRMHWSTPWWDAHMTTACHSTGCSVGVRRTSKKPEATLRNAKGREFMTEKDTQVKHPPQRSRGAERLRSKRWRASWKALPWFAGWSRSSAPPPLLESALVCESVWVAGRCVWACVGGWKTALWGSLVTGRGSRVVGRRGFLLGRSAGGQLCNHNRLVPPGFSLPLDGNSRVGHKHRIWGWKINKWHKAFFLPSDEDEMVNTMST